MVFDPTPPPLDLPPVRRQPSLGRSRSERGLDLFDTPPIALEPLLMSESLLAGVTSVCEPFCGKGNLVIAMRARGIAVHASDIIDRGCADSTVLDFRTMTERPPGCVISNPPYAGAMGHIEHALALGFRVIVLLLKLSFLSTVERHERLHKPGHLRRVHILAERLHDMHDAAHIAKGGKKAAQSQCHAWFVFDHDYCGPSTNIPVSIKVPGARMPWAERASDNADNGERASARGTSKAYVLARLQREGREDLAALVRAGTPSARGALRQVTTRRRDRNSEQISMRIDGRV